MTKDHWMYVAIAAAGVAAYLYWDKSKMLKALKAANVQGIPSPYDKEVAAA